MKLVKKIKIKINDECKQYLEFASERCRLLYNFALAERKKHYEEIGESLSIYVMKKRLPALKEQFPEYKEVYNKCLSAMYFRLDEAYKHFFLKNNQFPKFRRKGEFISQEYPGMYVIVIDSRRFFLPAGNRQRFIARTTEPIPEKFGTVVIKKQSGRYYACFTEEHDSPSHEINENVISVDLGIKTLCSCYSTRGEFISIPKFSHYTKHLDTLRSNRDLCKKGSRRWKKLTRTLAKQYDRYKNRVMDYLHKASHYLMNSPESTVVCGKLNLETMKTERSWFNRILLNEWRVKSFVAMLKYKAEKFGKIFQEIDESYTTQECFSCGKRHKLSLSDRTYECECGWIFNRDFNSALNIMKRFNRQAMTAYGDIGELMKIRNLNVHTFVHV